MKSLVITGYGEIRKDLAFIELDKPDLKQEQAQVEVYAASVNPLDYKTIEGALRPIKKLKFPVAIGFDVSGIVIEKGSKVEHLEVGDGVCARVSTDSPGTFAELIAIDSDMVTT